MSSSDEVEEISNEPESEVEVLTNLLIKEQSSFFCGAKWSPSNLADILIANGYRLPLSSGVGDVKQACDCEVQPCSERTHEIVGIGAMAVLDAVGKDSGVGGGSERPETYKRVEGYAFPQYALSVYLREQQGIQLTHIQADLLAERICAKFTPSPLLALDTQKIDEELRKFRAEYWSTNHYGPTTLDEAKFITAKFGRPALDPLDEIEIANLKLEADSPVGKIPYRVGKVIARAICHRFGTRPAVTKEQIVNIINEFNPPLEMSVPELAKAIMDRLEGK